MINLIEKLAENKFLTRQKQDGNQTLSSVIVDFNPVLKKLGTNGLKPFCLIHLRARPINDKSLWRWGIFWQTDYHLVSHYETELVRSFSLELEDVAKPDNPPTWVICYWDIKVKIKRDVAYIRSTDLKYDD